MEGALPAIPSLLASRLALLPEPFVVLVHGHLPSGLWAPPPDPPDGHDVADIGSAVASAADGHLVVFFMPEKQMPADWTRGVGALRDASLGDSGRRLRRVVVAMTLPPAACLAPGDADARVWFDPHAGWQAVFRGDKAS